MNLDTTLRRLSLLAPALLALALAGCTTKAWYEGTKRSAESECQRLPPGESAGCLARVNPLSYEDYERRRASSAQ